MTTSTKIYTLSKFKEELTNIFDWDSIIENTNGVYTEYIKKYEDDSGYVSLRVLPKTGEGSNSLDKINIAGTLENGEVISAMVSHTYFNLNQLNIVTSDNGIIITVFNSTDSVAYDTKPAYAVGIVKGEDIITKEVNYCAFMLDNEDNNNVQPMESIIGKHSQGATFVPSIVYTNANQLYELGLPILNPYTSTAVPLKILRRASYRNGYEFINGSFNFNGATYYGIGNLIIPTDF